MALDNATKARIIAEYKRGDNDTGSPEVQIALLTARIEGCSRTSARTRRITTPAGGC